VVLLGHPANVLSFTTSRIGLRIEADDGDPKDRRQTTLCVTLVRHRPHQNRRPAGVRERSGITLPWTAENDDRVRP
jgi:hypothetical protein